LLFLKEGGIKSYVGLRRKMEEALRRVSCFTGRKPNPYARGHMGNVLRKFAERRESHVGEGRDCRKRLGKEKHTCWGNITQEKKKMRRFEGDHYIQNPPKEKKVGPVRGQEGKTCKKREKENTPTTYLLNEGDLKRKKEIRYERDKS